MTGIPQRFHDHEWIRYATAIWTTGGTTTLTDEQEDVNTIQVVGTLVSNVTIEFSGERGVWIVTNSTTGAFTVTFKVWGQTGVTVTQGTTKNLYCNGTDIADAESPLHKDDVWLMIRHYYEGVLESAPGDRYRISTVDRLFAAKRCTRSSPSLARGRFGIG